MCFIRKFKKKNVLLCCVESDLFLGFRSCLRPVNRTIEIKAIDLRSSCLKKKKKEEETKTAVSSTKGIRNCETTIDLFLQRETIDQTSINNLDYYSLCY